MLHNKVSNTSLMSPKYHFVVIGRMLKLCFQVHNTVLLTIVILLYIRSPEVIQLFLEICSLWPTCPHFPHHSAPGNHHSALCFYEFDIFYFSYLCSQVTEGMILVLVIIVPLMPVTKPCTGAQRIFAVTSNRINKSPRDEIKHLGSSFPFNFLLFVVSILLINYSGFGYLI